MCSIRIHLTRAANDSFPVQSFDYLFTVDFIRLTANQKPAMLTMLSTLWLSAAIISPIYLRLLQWRSRRVGIDRAPFFRFCMAGAFVMSTCLFAGLLMGFLGFKLTYSATQLAGRLVMWGHDLQLVLPVPRSC